MILRDPVHGLVSFDGKAERVIEALLATQEVQRLRRVRQLGLTGLVFPGAEHSRFSHAVGAAHVMVRLQDRIRQAEHLLPPELRLTPEAAADSLAASLLHDLGHGPFSHLFEEVLPYARQHEAWTVDILEDPDTEVHRSLESLSRGMASRVSSLLKGSYPLDYLSRAISGPLDVDRCDYLLRDMYMTGVRYGLYDLEWLLRAFTFGRVEQGSDGGARREAWVLAIEGRKGLPPMEGFFLARTYMYQQVYHHKATRAAECLLRAIFARLAELLREGAPPDPVPPAIRSAALGEPLTTHAYLRLDDVQLMYCIHSWSDTADPLLSRWCSDFINRRLPKTVPLPDEPEREADWVRARDAVRERLRNNMRRPELEVCLDVPKDYPYQEVAEEPTESLWVVFRQQPMQRLGEVSFLLRQLRDKCVRRPRLIFPANVREQAERILAEVIG